MRGVTKIFLTATLPRSVVRVYAAVQIHDSKNV